MPTVLFYIVLLVVLLALSALFSMSETALFSLPSERLAALRRSEGASDRRVAALLANPRRLLVSIIFANTTVNILFYATCFVLTLRLLAAGWSWGGVAVSIGSLLAVVIFGEVSPKAVAVHYAERVSGAVALPVSLTCRILGPIVGAFDGAVGHITRGMLRGRTNPPLELDELKLLIEETRKDGAMDPREKALIEEVVDLCEIKVREVMVPRVDVAMVASDASREELLAVARDAKRATIPVYSGTRDRIVGVVSLKRALLEPDRPLAELLEEVPFVPENQSIDALLTQFRHAGGRFAVVLDEYGGTEGIVTLEDVVEEIVGDITEDYDDDAEAVREIGEGEYLLAGNLPVREWEELFGMSFEDTGITTLGGYVMDILGHVPGPGESVTRGRLRFTVESMKGRRIEKVRLQYLGDQPTDGSS